MFWCWTWNLPGLLFLEESAFIFLKGHLWKNLENWQALVDKADFRRRVMRWQLGVFICKRGRWCWSKWTHHHVSLWPQNQGSNPGRYLSRRNSTSRSRQVAHSAINDIHSYLVLWSTVKQRLHISSWCRDRLCYWRIKLSFCLICCHCYIFWRIGSREECSEYEGRLLIWKGRWSWW